GVVGTLQATEAIKLILGIGEPLIGELLVFDALYAEFNTIQLQKKPDCPICGDNQLITELIDYEQFCGMPAHDHSLYVAASTSSATGLSVTIRQMTPRLLQARLANGDELLLLDVRELHEWDISNLGHLGAWMVPKEEVLGRVHELNRSQETVIYCRSGQRSAEIITALQAIGFKNLWNLDGGINRWAQDVAPDIPIY
ncbi:MAG: hypothetical protein KAG66_12480, partial [Methylococcales bacterium]|nr:hypothetical protein [Methylococcales bacterium]